MLDDFMTQEQIDEFIPEEWDEIEYGDPLIFMMGTCAVLKQVREKKAKEARRNQNNV